MARLLRKKQPRANGASSTKNDPLTHIRFIDYGQDHVEEGEPNSLQDVLPFKESSTVTWLSVEGFADKDGVRKLAKQYDIHSLVIGDILDTDQQPKIDVFDQYIFLVARVPTFNQQHATIKSEQVSIVL